MALGSLATLMALLGSLMLYDRFTGPALPQDMNSFTRTEIQKVGGQEKLAPDSQGDEAVPGTINAEGQPAAPAQAKPEPKAPTSLVPPLAGEHKVVQPYAFMFSEVYGDYRLHPGVDYAAARGASVLAAAAGTVISVQTDPVEGRMVELDHGGGLVTRYGGLGQVMVSLNGTVQAGHILGQVGDPSPAKQAMGSHLHFEVLLSGTPLDPTLYYQP